MSNGATAVAAGVPRSPARPAGSSMMRVTLASLAGTSLEFYDHFIYGTAAALVFPKVFFANMTPDLALMLSLVTYGIAFVARPLGAVLFGHFGDRVGRKNILVIALLMMGLATFLIGCLPNYLAAGAFGAYALCVLRLIQGLALGGQWGGAALMVNEYAKNSRWKGFLGSMVQIASPVGFLTAAGVFALITALVSGQAFLSWGWRVPFLASAVLVIIGLYIRSTTEESPEFLESQKAGAKDDSAPMAQVVKYHWRRLLLAIGTRTGSDIAFYIFALFGLVYLPRIGVSKEVALQAGIAGAVAQAIGIPLFGYLSDKFSTRSVLAFSTVATLLWGFVHFTVVNTAQPGLIVLASFIGLFFHSGTWAPLAAHLPRMFPVEVRFTGAGVGFQAAGILGGALAPTIAVGLLVEFNNNATPISIYLGASLAVALVCILLTRPFGEKK